VERLIHGPEAVERWLRADIERLFGCKIRVAPMPSGKTGPEIQLVLRSAVKHTVHPEGYRLDADGEGVRIIAGDARGLYYGAQTLLQILRRPGPKALTAPACRIEDSPDLARRAVHPPRLWPGSNLAYFRRYFDILARARFNLVVWEISGSVRFPGLPWAWKEKGSFEPGAIRDIIADARRRGLEMIPELECLGHANEWLGGDPGDLDRFPWLRACFEDRRRTDLCTSNPKTREVVCRTIDAVSALFDHPRLFHIGLDESWRFATCPVCSKRDPAALLADWLRMLHDHLAQRGQSMMMWHDMLLAKKRFKGAVANGDYEPEEVTIVSCRVDKAAVMKRWRPRARGTATRILKPTSHIYVEVSEEGKKVQEQKSAPVKKTPGKKKTPIAETPAETGAKEAARAAAESVEKKDDLTKIKGIGKAYQEKLNNEGIFTYEEVANMTDGQIAVMEEKYKFKGDFRESVADAKNIVNGKEA
jgi:predicted flap endonuclease-1-like 5' DNA nuclease/uncharacterized Zn-finger protein